LQTKPSFVETTNEAEPSGRRYAGPCRDLREDCRKSSALECPDVAM